IQEIDAIVLIDKETRGSKKLSHAAALVSIRDQVGFLHVIHTENSVRNRYIETPVRTDNNVSRGAFGKPLQVRSLHIVHAHDLITNGIGGINTTIRPDKY